MSGDVIRLRAALENLADNAVKFTSEGTVTLTGTVGSAELIGRTVSLALDTEGVTEVVSLLTVSPAP